MTFENYIKARLVDYAVNEAYHHGGTNGMCAVAQVLANRVKLGWGDWKQVIDTAPNYIGTTVKPPKFEPRDLTFRRMLSLIDDIYQGTSDDSNINIEDDRGHLTALYYAELHNIDRRWFVEHVTSNMEKHPRIAVVGPLSFFA